MLISSNDIFFVVSVFSIFVVSYSSYPISPKRNEVRGILIRSDHKKLDTKIKSLKTLNGKLLPLEFLIAGPSYIQSQNNPIHNISLPHAHSVNCFDFIFILHTIFPLTSLLLLPRNHKLHLTQILFHDHQDEDTLLEYMGWSLNQSKVCKYVWNPRILLTVE